MLTASGGPFRGRARASLAGVTPAEALAHPTWDMGRVITMNSATLVNKGLEVIEAHLLFGVPYERIEVTVHPQSIVHSMVEFVDGSTLAQASPPDMRLPISLGLDWPSRVPGVGRPLDWSTASAWTFEPLDEEAFPAVALAKRVGEAGRTYPAVFNAANEVAVHAFHDGAIGFLGILETVERVVEAHCPRRPAPRRSSRCSQRTRGRGWRPRRRSARGDDLPAGTAASAGARSEVQSGPRSQRRAHACRADVVLIVGVLVIVVGLAVSIGLHELGHLIPAKLFGVRVSQYMIGFGPTLWSRRRGETEYGVKAIRSAATSR